MKKIIFTLIIVCLVIGTVSAQNWGWNNLQPVTVTGVLQLQNGVIAVDSGSDVYFVPALSRHVGFIDGLREGAQISVEGFASGNFILPAKITLSGRTIDLTANITQSGGLCCYGWGHHSGRRFNSQRRW